MFGHNPGSQSSKRSAAANLAPIRSWGGEAKGGINALVGLVIGLAILSVVAGLTILAAGTSAGIVSAITQILAFMGLIGLAVAVGIVRKLGLF